MRSWAPVTILTLVATVRNADVRASRVALIADSVVNGMVDGATEVVDALVDAGFGFLMLPPHDFELASTPTTVEYIVDDAIDYRRNGYDVITVGVAALPQRGIWAELLEAEFARWSEVAFREFDFAEVIPTALAALSPIQQ